MFVVMDIEGFFECFIHHPKNKLRISTYELVIIMCVSISKRAQYEGKDWLTSDSVKKIHPYKKIETYRPLYRNLITFLKITFLLPLNYRTHTLINAFNTPG
jgi:hypothetical protein